MIQVGFRVILEVETNQWMKLYAIIHRYSRQRFCFTKEIVLNELFLLTQLVATQKREK